MSFILDALKKSENERQRQAGPGFATIPESPGKRPRKIWPIVVVALLAINLVVIGAVLVRGRSSGPSANTGAAPPGEPAASSVNVAQAPRTVPPVSTPGPPQPAPVKSVQDRRAATPQQTAEVPDTGRGRQIRPLSEEAATDTMEPPPSAPAGAAPPLVTDEPPPAATRPAAQTPMTASPSADNLPTANDLRIEGFLSGPPLHLDLHVYYPDRQRRVVFINGSKYREGDTVKGGPVVREIVPEGVILEERGRRYLLMPD